MAYDDLLFATASVIAVTGLLRGGEFTFRSGQSRPILLQRDINMKMIEGVKTLVVNVRQAKTTWWEHDSFVPIHGAVEESPFSPVALYEELRRRDMGAGTSTPAFHFMDSRRSPLTRDFMLKKTAGLLKTAGISILDARGAPMPLKLASYRSGGLHSSLKAGNDVPTMKMQGRWKSDAWEHYLMENSKALSAAGSKMWSRGEKMDSSTPRVVVECTSTFFPEHAKQDAAQEAYSAAALAALAAFK